MPITQIAPSVRAVFLEKLHVLYSEMDAAYENAARSYGFHCRGCGENCCETRFYHHTWIEYLGMDDGFAKLPEDIRESCRKRAGEVIRRMRAADTEGRTRRIMCPVNIDGRCAVYDARPMICRMHGIPHELRRPGRAPDFGPGCGSFMARFGGKGYIAFDRTPFYRKMAFLESDFRRAAGLAGKFRRVMAEMLPVPSRPGKGPLRKGEPAPSPGELIFAP